VRTYRLPRVWTAALVLTGLSLATQPSRCETWPERTVHIVTPFGPGISPDAAARIVGEALAKRWKQAVVIENKPGGDTMVGTRAFLAARDSHSLLFTAQSTFAVIPLLHAEVPYDPIGDGNPISLVVEDFLSVVAAPSLQVGSLSDFVSVARQGPAKLNFYAAPGAPYLAYLAFQKRAGIETTFVPYNSPPSAIADLSEGRIHIAVMPLASVLGAVHAGKIKLLAVTNAMRSPAAPQVPTVQEAGYPDLSFGGFLGLFAPKDMAPDLRDRIAADVSVVLKDSEVEQRLTSVGLIARGTTPAVWRSILGEQRTKWAAIARANHIEPK
jgi:tripartite-type tricarboxylate transporter receptor subunit TctC